MKRTTVVLLGAIAMAAMSSPARSESPVSPWEMAVATEQWLVEGAGARFPDGMADPASDGDFVFVDGSWPLPFRERVGEAVALRISPDTGCYEFADPDGTVFWTVVPVAPLTWNWISPFRSPLRPDARDLYSPFRIAREWLLLSPAEFDSRAESAENAEPLVTRHSSLVTRGAAGPATNLCFTAFSYTETNLFFAAAWPTNETLPEAVLDLYGSTNLLDPRWTFLSSHPATTNPVSFAVAPAALPWYVEPTQHVHDATCAVATNVVLSPLDGVTVYTNVVWPCTTNRTPVPPGFFQLGTHHDTDGDGLFDSFEKLASGTDPASSDTDGDGVPDGLTWAQWRSHPLWAENGDGTNLVVFLYEPVTNGFAALRFGDLCIPLASNAGPWCLCVPTNAVVDCTLVSGADTVAMLWYGPPEAVEWTPVNRSAPGPRWTWDVPDDVAVPIWCDRPMSVFGGNVGGGSCRFARPELRIRSEEPGQEGCLDVCVHGSEGIARFSWSVEPSACTGLWAFATGHLSDSGDGRSFCIDVSNAVPGSSGARTGMLFAESIRSPFFGDDVLFGTLSGTVSAHRCEGLPDPAFGYCLSCGVVHDAPASAGACYHEPGCATKTNLFEDCDCAPPFVRIGGTAALRIVGDFLSCCHAHDFYPSHAELLSAPDGLRASLSNGLFLGVAPEARSPTIGGFVADCRIWDWNGAPYRDQAVRFTCADLRVEPVLSELPGGSGNDPVSHFVTNGRFHVARRSAPYPIRLWNESPSDARLVFGFDAPTNGPTVRPTPSGMAHGTSAITNSSPFSALNSDTTVYLDANCSNALATLTLTLSDPATNRTFLAESLSVQVVHTDLGEHWRVRSATDRLSWDFSDAPEPVWICLRYPPQHGETLGQMVGNPVVSKTPSFSLDLPPGDYMIEAYFPRVYAGERSEWEVTNTLHVASIATLPESAEALIGGQVRTRFMLSENSSPKANWSISPVLENGARLFSADEGGSYGNVQLFNCSSVWVSAGSISTNYIIHANDTRVDSAEDESSFEVLPLRLVPDYGFDLSIDNNDVLDASTGRVFRIWINDDVDAASSPYVYHTDIPQFAGSTSTSAPDCYDDRVGGYFDLIDFFPLWMNCRSALESFSPADGFSWILRQTTPSVKLVWTSLSKNEAGSFQTDPVNCAGSQFSDQIVSSSVSELTGGNITVPEPFLTLCKTNPNAGVFLIEGAADSSAGLELVVEKNGKVFGRTVLPLSVSPVDEMYRTLNLRPNLGGSTSPQTRLSEPSNLPDGECSSATVAFVHGFNVDHDEARGWFSETFKRLRWSGNQAKFIGVTWEGDVGWPNGMHYHEDVDNAFRSAQQLASSLGPFSTNLAVIAHSLGNMVVGTSICDCGLRPEKFFLLNAAVPEEAFDDSFWNDSTNGNPMVHHEWKDYHRRTWAANWHELFDGDRGLLTWKNRFVGLLEVSGLALYNYYSSGDEVIGLYTSVSADGMVHMDGFTGHEMRNHSWQKQERLKGRAGFDTLSGLAGTDEAGWGFRQLTRWVETASGNHGYFEQYNIPSSIANAISTNDLVTNTVFRPNPQTLFSSNQTRSEIDARLAKAIPALSGGIGANPLFGVFGQSRSYDMQQPGNPIAFPNGRISHSPYGTAFRHSDIKGLSYYHCFNIWRKLASDLAEEPDE